MRLIPLNATSNGSELSKKCSIPGQGLGEHCQLITRHVG